MFAMTPERIRFSSAQSSQKNDGAPLAKLSAVKLLAVTDHGAAHSESVCRRCALPAHLQKRDRVRGVSGVRWENGRVLLPIGELS